MNAAAGGGSFVTLPAMIFAGVPSVEANASSTVALFPARWPVFMLTGMISGHSRCSRCQ